MNRRQFFAATAVATLWGRIDRPRVIEADDIVLTAEHILCRIALVDPHRLRRGHLTDAERRRLLDAASWLSEMPIYLVERNRPVTFGSSGGATRLL